MPVYLHTNNANSNLALALTAAATSVRVTAGHGSMFPNPSAGQTFFLTVEDRRAGRLEIMLCRARSGDTMTVTRGQQGTIPLSFEVGANVSNRVTAQVLNDFVTATNEIVPLERLPSIPDSKLITVSSARLFGTIASSLLPTIPPALLTSVPAASLTGTISSARLPPIPSSLLPVIPPALLTSVPAASLTGTISTARLPAIPPSLLTSVPAASLTGRVENDRISGNYDNFVDISCSVVYANEIRAIQGGSATDATYTWSGREDYGMYLNEDTGNLGFTINGDTIFYIRDDSVLLDSACRYVGDGSGLTNLVIPPFLPNAGAISSYAMMKYMGTANTIDHGTIVAGNLLEYCSAGGYEENFRPASSTTWKCMGFATNLRNGEDQVTLWMRMT